MRVTLIVAAKDGTEELSGLDVGCWMLDTEDHFSRSERETENRMRFLVRKKKKETWQNIGSAPDPPSIGTYLPIAWRVLCKQVDYQVGYQVGR